MRNSNHPPPGEETPPSELVAGKYRLTRLVGRGGMGSVWEGVHATLDVRVAIKFIESQYLGNPEARQRFENEARAAASLQSRHVVHVFDHGLMQDGRPYIVMEFLSGEPLDRRLDRVGRLGALEAARLVVQVCRALSKAHHAGIVHRDLKPENIFLVWDAEEGADIAKVVDFGIAKFADRSTLTSATRTGSVLGTPYYMSPEQARGLRTVDHRSDLWSVGVIAYQCLVGRLPFQGESVGDLLVTICTGTLPIPSQAEGDLPRGFDAWFARALARAPEARFQSAGALAEGFCEAMGINMQQESWGTAGSRLVSGIATPSLLSSSVTTPQVTPEAVTIKAPAGQRSALTRYALPAVAVAALGGFGLLQMQSNSNDAQTAAPQASVAPARAQPAAGAAEPAPALREKAENTVPSATAAPEPAPPSVAPVPAAPSPAAPVARGSSRGPARAGRTAAAALKPTAAEPTPAPPVIEPPPAPKAPEPAPAASPRTRTNVDIDKSDPWRK